MQVQLSARDRNQKMSETSSLPRMVPEHHWPSIEGSGHSGPRFVMWGPPLMPPAKMTASVSSEVCLPSLSTTLTAETPLPAGMRTRSWAELLPGMAPPLRRIRSAGGSRMRSALAPAHAEVCLVRQSRTAECQQVLELCLDAGALCVSMRQPHSNFRVDHAVPELGQSRAAHSSLRNAGCQADELAGHLQLCIALQQTQVGTVLKSQVIVHT